MEVTTTRKIQLYPSEDQQRVLRELMCNYIAAAQHVATVVFEQQSTSVNTIHPLVYRITREQFNLKSQMAASVIRTVCAKFRTIHHEQPEWSILPEFTAEMANFVWNRDYSLKRDGSFSLATHEGRCVIATEWNGNQEYKGLTRYGGATLIERKGKFYLQVAVTTQVEDTHILNMRNVKGIDVGINFLATTYDSSGCTEFYSGKKAKHVRGTHKAIRNDLQRRNTRSSKKKLKNIGSRESRWMDDMNHSITKALVDTDVPTLFVCEDLTGIRSTTEAVRKCDRYAQVSWAFYSFRQKLEYKARLHGHQVIFVKPNYTSQRCPKCGFTHKGNRDKKKHLFTCKSCGYRSNDDRIAAMNLHQLGIAAMRQTIAIILCYCGVLSITQNVKVNMVLLQVMLSQFKVGDLMFNDKGHIVNVKSHTTGERQTSSVRAR